MYSVVKLDYKLNPPLYQEDRPQDKFFIKEVFGEGSSIIKDCYNAYSEAIDEVLDQTRKKKYLRLNGITLGLMNLLISSFAKLYKLNFD